MANPCGVWAPPGLVPPAVRSPKLIHGAAFAFFRRQAMRTWIRRHGRIFVLNIPFFGRSVIVSDPTLVKSVCSAGADQLIDVRPSMSNLFGPGSIFGLDGDAHRDRRRLLAPAFHGHALKEHEKVIEDETLRESANWPEGTEFRMLEPMSRITLNVILRAIFGDAGSELERLRATVPPFMRRGQLLAFLPVPPRRIRSLSPWRRLDDFRDEFDGIVGTLADAAEADPGLGERTDILASLVRARLPRPDICDEVLTLIGAGHETTAAALGWVFERLRRHPEVLAEVVKEVDQGGNALRRATITEVLRVRTVIDVAGRRVSAPDFGLGPWQIPRDHTVLLRIADLHEDAANFPQPERFDPYRFCGTRMPGPGWLAFGGGARRCLGADFAVTEMDVVLRTVLRNFRIQTDAAPDERSVFRGVAHTPKHGARVVLHRRT